MNKEQIMKTFDIYNTIVKIAENGYIEELFIENEEYFKIHINDNLMPLAYKDFPDELKNKYKNLKIYVKNKGIKIYGKAIEDNKPYYFNYTS